MTTNNESKLILELAWAKVLLKSCLDVLETHNEPIVKRLRNDVSDFLKDDYNLLKNQQNFNISEGNVKDDNIKSGKTKHGDFIVKYLEEGSHYKVKEINVMENVVQSNSLDLDHIADTSKKVSLKHLWSKRELDGAYYIKNGNGEYEVNIFQDKRKDYRFVGSSISEFVCEVPSYEQWQSLNELLDSMRDTNKVLAHKLNNIKVNGNYPDKISKLKSRIKGLMEKNEKLEELLKECWQEIKPLWDKALWDNPERMPYSDRFIRLDKLKTKIDEVLK